MESLEKILHRESSAVEKRNWIRLTSLCNNRCSFCLDSDAHNGTVTGVMDVKAQILSGKKNGATRLILSGGEPTIHPNYVDFIKFGKALGYRRIQTVTNGRMFAYKDFTKKTIDAGLGEVTFSVHGHNAKLHDALVGCPGAFDEELQGVDNVLADGRAIVNIDVVLTRKNIAHVRDIMELFIARGVYEFDLLQIIPFGRAWSDEYRDILFYDVEEAHPHIQRALELKAHPMVHIWTNRFPLVHLEGHEELIQDPHKLFDEVRGRMAQFDAYIDAGEPLSCRDPARCKHCFLQRFCDGVFTTHARATGSTVDAVAKPFAGSGFDAFRVDLRGGRTAAVPAVGMPDVRAAWLVADDVAQVKGVDVGALPGEMVWLEVADLKGIGKVVKDGKLGGKPIQRVIVRRGEDVAAAFGIGGGSPDFEVKLLLTPESAPWIEKHVREEMPGLVLGAESHELLSDTARHTVDHKDFFARYRSPVPVEDIPACLAGPTARTGWPTIFDAAMLDAGGRFAMYGYVQSFVVDSYYSRSIRCDECVMRDECRGLHVNYIRRFGFRQVEPIRAPA
jgi:MoaA/NifB/PqqE/SkfB family radical SAM enzyme